MIAHLEDERGTDTDLLNEGLEVRALVVRHVCAGRSAAILARQLRGLPCAFKERTLASREKGFRDRGRTGEGVSFEGECIGKLGTRVARQQGDKVAGERRVARSCWLNPSTRAAKWSRYVGLWLLHGRSLGCVVPAARVSEAPVRGVRGPRETASSSRLYNTGKVQCPQLCIHKVVNEGDEARGLKHLRETKMELVRTWTAPMFRCASL